MKEYICLTYIWKGCVCTIHKEILHSSKIETYDLISKNRKKDVNGHLAKIDI